MRRLSILGRWGFGLFLAAVIVWVVGAFFLNSVTVWEWDPHVKRWLPKAGMAKRWTSEGWAVTRIGKYGITETPNISLVREPKIVIWGDSYVEAFQVPAEQKMDALLTEMGSIDGIRRWRGVGIGMSGRNFADYCFLIPRYRSILGDVKCHVIIFNIADTLPDGQRIQNDPENPFRDHVRGITHLRIRNLAYRYHLSAAWNISRDLPQIDELRFRPGPSEGLDMHEAVIPSPEQMTSLWDAQIQRLKEACIEPLLLVYIAGVPTIANGRIDTNDPMAKHAETLAQLCAEHGVPMINMQDEFLGIFFEHQRFPRGFNNSSPDKGHLNELGHRAVAGKIVEHLLGRNDAL
jgi:hypothetical protein